MSSSSRVVVSWFYCFALKLIFLSGYYGTQGSSVSPSSPFEMYPYMRMLQLFPPKQKESPLNWQRTTLNDFDLKYHPCRRQCHQNETMTCYYYFIVHYDETMSNSCDRYLESQYRFKHMGKTYIDGRAVRGSYDDQYDDCKYADGVRTNVMVINGRLPGQQIEVCEGDTLVVDVINSLHESTTVHWHGIHNRATPHMDGVPHITQYPIETGQGFRYSFVVDRGGTNWWHSHTEHQRAYGLAGALIVRQPDGMNVHRKLYDFDYSEHTIMLQDWFYDCNVSMAANILINGLGRNVQQKRRNGNQKDHGQPILYSNFDVVRGGRYRFRVILNGISNCPMSFSIDQHDLVVISSDGNDIEPVSVQKLTIHGGERFDFVLHANQDIENYWIRVKGNNFCNVSRLHQEAILRYHGADAKKLPTGLKLSYDYEAKGIELNPVDLPPSDDDTGEYITIAQTTANPKRYEPPFSSKYTYYISMAVNQRGDNSYFQIDDITFSMPKFSLLQSRNLGIGKFFCNKSSLANDGLDCRNEHCKCANIIEVPAFKQVEFVISSHSSSAHPVHLHGYTARVIGMGVLGPELIDSIEDIDRQTRFPRRKVGAPLKDSIQVPSYGYIILRFYTDSPGYWIIHCHISTHSENGMTAVIRVGDDSQMKMCPVSNCGLCNSLF